MREYEAPHRVRIWLDNECLLNLTLVQFGHIAYLRARQIGLNYIQFQPVSAYGLFCVVDIRKGGEVGVNRRGAETGGHIRIPSLEVYQRRRV
jgi:hypothetical protein